MNWDIIEGKWDQFKGQMKSKWAKLTDEDLTSLSGKKDQLIGKIQERYGVLKDDAERQVDDWISSIDTDSDKPRPSSRRPQSSSQSH